MYAEARRRVVAVAHFKPSGRNEKGRPRQGRPFWTNCGSFCYYQDAPTTALPSAAWQVAPLAVAAEP
jgi:hypothetical protein